MNKELLRTIKFTLFSMSAGLIQAGSFAIFDSVLKIGWQASYLISLALSVIWNFTLNRKFTFKSATNVPIAMLKVAVFYAVFTPLTTALGNYLTGTLGWHDYIATGINMVLNLVLEYLYDKYYVFKGSIDSAENK